MSLMDSIRQMISPAPERRSMSLNSLLDAMNVAQAASAGVSVTPENALNQATVYSCVRILSEDVAALPLILYRRLERGKERATEHPLYRILHDAPNDLMTSFEWRETMMSHLLLWGNAYSEIEIGRNGSVAALWPLNAANILEVRREGNEMLYRYQLPGGQIVNLPGWRVFHLRGMSSDGIMGYSPIQLAREAIGLGVATEKYGAKWFGNGARPGVVLQHPGRLTTEGHERLLKTWNTAHQGLDNAQRTAIIEEGMTLTQVGIPPEDSQFLETRKYQKEEIAGIYRVPLMLLQSGDKPPTYASAEQFMQGYVTHTLGAWLVRVEQGINARLLTRRDAETYFAEHLVDALLRGDTATRYQAYTAAFQNGIMSVNEIREAENRNPIAGGDVHFVPLNLVPLEQALNPPEPPPPEPAPQEEQPTEPAQREQRALQTRAGLSRQRMALAYQPTLKDVAQRLVSREVNDIRNAARNRLPRSQAEFDAWFDAFLEDHPTIVRKYLDAPLTTYGRQTLAEVERELGREVAEKESFLDFLAGFIVSRSNVWTGELRKGVRKALEDARLENLDELAELETALDDRSAREAGMWSNDMTHRTHNALAKMAYGLAGVQALRWVSFGETCPYCEALDGAVVGIQQAFLSGGSPFRPEGAESDLTPQGDIGHPPAHDGCDCAVVAG